MYTLVIDHFETGLGRHFWLARIAALSEDDAILKFRKLFKQFDDDAAWSYFKIGLDVYNDNIKVQRESAEKILKKCLKKYFTTSLLTENINFSMEFSYNFS